MTHSRFPEDFVWGAATAAYQIEGAATRRRPRPVDLGHLQPYARARSADGHTGDVACDHYHRYRDDVALMRELGLRRVPVLGRLAAHPARRHRPGQPARAGLLRPAGRRAARRGESTRCVTLYHWDLPQALEDRGGWTNRDTAYRFADYAAARARPAGRPGARRGRRSTSRGVSAFLGYANGVHAPGRQEPGGAPSPPPTTCCWATAWRRRALRAAGRAAASASRSTSAADRARPTRRAPARRRRGRRLIDGLQNRLFLDPLLRGALPGGRAREHAARIGGPTHIQRRRPEAHRRADRPARDQLLHPVRTWQAGPAAPATPPTRAPRASSSCRRGAPTTAMGWPIDADRADPAAGAARRTTTRGGPLMITENGAAFDDGVDCRRPAGCTTPTGSPTSTGTCARRTRRSPGAWTCAAISSGRCWTTSSGRRATGKRFGIVHVDYADPAARTKDSALWYRGGDRRERPVDAAGRDSRV